MNSRCPARGGRGSVGEGETVGEGGSVGALVLADAGVSEFTGETGASAAGSSTRVESSSTGATCCFRGGSEVLSRNGVGVGVGVGVGDGGTDGNGTGDGFGRGTSVGEATKIGPGVPGGAVPVDRAGSFSPVSSSMCLSENRLGSSPGSSSLTVMAKSPSASLVVSIFSHGVSRTEGLSSQNRTFSSNRSTFNRNRSPFVAKRSLSSRRTEMVIG